MANSFDYMLCSAKIIFKCEMNFTKVTIIFLQD